MSLYKLFLFFLFVCSENKKYSKQNAYTFSKAHGKTNGYILSAYHKRQKISSTPTANLQKNKLPPSNKSC